MSKPATSSATALATDVAFDVFLSHNTTDKPAVRHIKERLAARKLRCWFDEADMRGGVDWTTRLEDGLRRSRCCAIFYGPSGIGPWHEMERQLAQLMAVEAWRDGQHFGIIPVRLPDAPEWRKLALPPFLRLYTSVEFPSLSDDAALNRLTAGILQEAPPPEMPDSDRAPYIGMRPFTEADSAIFTGRNNYIIHIAEQVHRAEPPQFLAVLGASGSGKSSLLHAGVLPWLRQGTLHSETKDWLYVTMRPGNDAIANLDAALRSIPALRPHLPPPGASRDAWRADLLHGCAAAALGTAHGAPRLVLIVDQFEELFAFRPSGPSAAEEKRRLDYMANVWEPFVRNLARAASERAGPVSVIVSMRADFLAQFAEDEHLAPFLTDFRHRCLIQPLSEREVRAAIERPAVSRGLSFDAALVETVVQDYQLDPAGALPFLQEALLRVWEKGGRRELSLAHYREFGGLRGAVNAQADHVLRTFAAQSPAKAVLIPNLFIYLTRLADDGGPDTKRRRLLSELPGGEPEQALALELATAEHRLLVLDDIAGKSAAAEDDEQPERSGATVEIAHESLLVGWKELKQWLNDKQRPDRLRLRRLESEARAWEDESNASDALLRQPELRRAEKLCRRFPIEIPQSLARFVAASRRAFNFRLIRNVGGAAAASAIIFAAAYWFLPGVGPNGVDPLPRLKQELEALAGQPKFPAPEVTLKAREVLAHENQYGRAWALLGRALLERKNFPELNETIQQWRERVPDDAARIDDLRGDKAASEGDLPAAVALWTDAAAKLEDAGQKTAAWGKLAWAHGELNQWDSAEEFLSYALAAQEGLEPRLQRFEAYRQLANWEAAANDLRYLQGTHPSHPKVKALGLPSERLREEHDDVSEKLRHQGHTTALYLERARLRIRAGALFAAQEDLRRISETDPQHEALGSACAALAAAYRQAGKNKFAEEAIRLAGEVRPAKERNP